MLLQVLRVVFLLWKINYNDTIYLLLVIIGAIVATVGATVVPWVVATLPQVTDCLEWIVVAHILVAIIVGGGLSHCVVVSIIGD